MYWLLIGEYYVKAVEAEDFDDLQRLSNSDLYHTAIKLNGERLQELKESIDEILT